MNEGNIVIFKGNNGKLLHESFSLLFPNANVVFANDLKQDKLIDNDNFHMVWKPTVEYSGGSHSRTVFGLKLKHSSIPRIVNHFPQNESLCTKTGMFESISKYYRKLYVEPDEVVPYTFIITSFSCPQWLELQIAFKSHQHWICKPNGLNCSRGIQVLSDLSGIKSYVLSDSNPVVVQKYIDNPMLWPNGERKFDIRMWVLVLQDCKVFMCREGYLRTCSEPYSMESLRDPTAHLTNYCLQRNSTNLGKYEQGSTLSFEQLQEYIDSTSRLKTLNLTRDLFPRFRSIIMDTLRASWDIISNKASCNGFLPYELFGYDFMLDSDANPWLIEVNTNPFVGVQNVWHGELLKRMTQEVANIVKIEYVDGNNAAIGDLELFERIDKSQQKEPKGRGQYEKWLQILSWNEKKNSKEVL